ncbi:sugar phosphate isomerase/epimerase [Flavobacterium sp.]|uniref:sugar phosphate isomerase/epimerase family protein n=1 Tax=Flavobacterium sp. TaxID=239 RepID=UPI002628CF60|nr:sugar phosphate isomerase/epimerase [Flavobacterium sp.]
MKLKYIAPFWGQEQLSAEAFLSKVVESGYDGVEINFPNSDSFVREFKQALQNIRESVNPEFMFIAQQVLGFRDEAVASYKQRMSDRLMYLLELQPTFVNSHTGRDYFDFYENCDCIEATTQLAKQYQIPIYHEIHRGRFSFHAKTLIPYLDIFPKLELVGDLSHFCVVSESMLEGQAHFLKRVFPRIRHLHARVGWQQAPQVNHPFAPEWDSHVQQFLAWWKEIVQLHRSKAVFSITPEFGPFPYLPQEPFSQKPFVNQWDINNEFKQFLKQNLSSYA